MLSTYLTVWLAFLICT